jgi:DNA-binding NarL/FixJ family response regulator
MREEILVGVVAEPRQRTRVTAALARDGIHSVVEADSIDELVRACSDRHPHVGVHVGGSEQTAELRRLARELPRTRLVAVVPASARDVVRGALRAGADGVVAAADLPATVAVTIPTAARSVLETAGLSHREREVLDLVAAGLSNTEIAQRLCVTEHTVKSHVGAVFGKLGVHSRREAIMAHAQGHGRFSILTGARSASWSNGDRV